jgi:hypothetical protein
LERKEIVRRQTDDKQIDKYLTSSRPGLMIGKYKQMPDQHKAGL